MMVDLPSSPHVIRRHRDLAGAITALAIATVFLISFISLMHLKEESKGRAFIATQDLASSMELTIDGLIASIDITLQVSADEIGRRWSTGTPDPPEITRFLIHQQDRIPHLDLLRATDEHGDACYGAGVPTPPANDSDRDYFARLRDDPRAGLVIANPIIGKISQRWMWLMARRITKPDGSFGGIVYASLFVEEIEKILRTLNMEAGNVIVLRDANLGLIARSTFDNTPLVAVGDRTLSRSFFEAVAANPDSGSYVSDASTVDGISRIFSYRRSPKHGYLVVVGVETRKVLAGWHKEAVFISALAGSLILLILFFSRQVSRTSWLQSAERALRTVERDLSEAQRIAQVGSYVVDVKMETWTSSKHCDEILGIDDHFKKTFESWLGLIDQKSRDDARDYYVKSIELKTSIDREFRIIRPCDAEERWIHSRGEFITNADGLAVTLTGTIQDITLRHRFEAEIMAAKEAAEFANQAKTVFLSHMSHELRTPLNTILGYSEMMSVGIGGSLNDAHGSYTHGIHSAGRHLIEIVDEILDLTSIEMNSYKLCPAAVDLAALGERCLDLTRPLAEAKGLTLTLTCTGPRPLMVRTDARALRQILINLIGNAIKYTGSGGAIDLGMAINGDVPELWVRDTGMGIPAEQMEAVFEPFHRVDPLHADPSRGLGLGLTICRRLVGLLGGRLRLESTIGIGTTAIVTLPGGTQDTPHP